MSDRLKKGYLTYIITGTPNHLGNLELQIPDNSFVISVAGNGWVIGIPFKANDGQWYAKCLKWDTTGWTQMQEEITLTVAYVV